MDADRVPPLMRALRSTLSVWRLCSGHRSKMGLSHIYFLALRTKGKRKSKASNLFLRK